MEIDNINMHYSLYNMNTNIGENKNNITNTYKMSWIHKLRSCLGQYNT